MKSRKDFPPGRTPCESGFYYWMGSLVVAMTIQEVRASDWLQSGFEPEHRAVNAVERMWVPPLDPKS
jgi:hypothetical protein